MKNLTFHTLFKRLRSSQSGAALVEFSLLLPILFGIMAAALEFGRAIYQFHVADKGVKSAARFLARVPGDSSCPPTFAAWAGKVTESKTLAQRGSFDTSNPYSLANWQNASDVTVTVACIDNTAGNLHGQDQIPIITVSTSFPFDDKGLLSYLKVASAITITASHQEVYIGG